MVTLSLSEAKARLSAVVDDVEQLGEHVEITRNGHPVAYLIPAADVQAMRETSFWMAQSDILASVARADADVSAGRTMSTTQARAWVAAGMPEDGLPR
jgi:prevent-host-death family protein